MAAATVYGAAPGKEGNILAASSPSRSKWLALGGVALLAVAAVSGYTLYVASPTELRLEDVYTEDRCVVYTYTNGGSGGGEMDVWMNAWSSAGWKPVVINEAHAALHPKYAEYSAKFHAIPKMNDDAYETACYLRHMAMAVIGGGLMTDNDVININVPPPPKCDTLPNDGKLTTHDSHVPSVISGDAAAFNGFIDGIAGADWNAVMAATGQSFLSDMIYTLYYARSIPVPTITPTMMYHSFPPSLPNPPCAKSGQALPMIFHLSHWMMTTAYGGADRVGTMNGEWSRLKDAASQCQPLSFDSASYEDTFWPVNPPAERDAFITPG